MTSPSADRRPGARRRGATLAATTVVVAAVVAGLLPATPAAADPSPAPSPGATSLEGLSAPVRSFSVPVRDFATVVESIDGTETERSTKTRRTVILDSKVLFAEDSARLSASARRRIQTLGQQVVDSGATGTVQVVGYTDDQGSAAYGLVLSRRRAAAVRDVLAPAVSGAGVRITTRGRGEAAPRFPNRDENGKAIPANQAKNRRVEITFSTR